MRITMNCVLEMYILKLSSQELGHNFVHSLALGRNLAALRLRVGPNLYSATAIPRSQVIPNWADID